MEYQVLDFPFVQDFAGIMASTTSLETSVHDAELQGPLAMQPGLPATDFRTEASAGPSTKDLLSTRACLGTDVVLAAEPIFHLSIVCYTGIIVDLSTGTTPATDATVMYSGRAVPIPSSAMVLLTCWVVNELDWLLAPSGLVPTLSSETRGSSGSRSGSSHSPSPNWN